MERRVRWKSYARCGAGEKLEITSKVYLSLSNHAQYYLVKLLASKHNNICVVGDDDQCIYQWRGADINNILDFERDYKNTKVIKLEKNYRSKANILQAANKVIANNHKRKEKTLQPTIAEGEKIKVYKASDPEEEALFICNEILRLIKSKGYENRDIGILYRTNAQSRIFEEVFIRNNISHKILGNLRFYDRKEIKDIISYIRVIVNSDDEISLRRIVNEPKRGIGDSTIDKIYEYGVQNGISLFDAMVASTEINTISSRSISKVREFVDLIQDMKSKINLKPSKLISYLLKQTEYLEYIKSSKDVKKEGRIENIEEFINSAINFENLNPNCKVADFLENVLLISESDNYDESSSSVTLMTLHSSKGLEFPVIFMVGMENGIFPGVRSFDDLDEMEESRRLCYVGITRAKDMLYLTHSSTRMVFTEINVGGKVSKKPVNKVVSKSKFLREIPEELLINVDFGGEEIKKEKIKNLNIKHSENNAYDNLSKNVNRDIKIERNNLLKENVKVGQKIKHKKFGEGLIIKLEESEEDVKLFVAFDNNGIKKMFLNKAPIEFI